jgi:hypothetical protein
MSPLAAIASVALLALSCSTAERDTGRRADEPGEAGTGAGGYPPEERHISLVIWPFYDVDDVLAATEDALPVPLEGVEVCLKKARPRMGTWEDFVETDGPCTTSRGGEPIALEGVPTDSELLVTATKDGYWPSVVAAMTSQWSTDVTRGSVPTAANQLLARDSAWPGPRPTEDDGVVSVVLVSVLPYDAAPLGGAALALAPGPFTGPLYGDGRTFDLDAVRTLPGLPTNPWALAGLVWENVRPGSWTVFSDIPPGDHVLHVEHPTAGCESWGLFSGDRVYGYSASRNEIRVPVLAGHTGVVLGICECSGEDRQSLDAATCQPRAPALPDAGAP